MTINEIEPRELTAEELGRLDKIIETLPPMSGVRVVFGQLRGHVAYQEGVIAELRQEIESLRDAPQPDAEAEEALLAHSAKTQEVTG